MPNATKQANARATLEAMKEDREIFALRAEFERLDATRRPLIGPATAVSKRFGEILHENGFETARSWDEKRGRPLGDKPGTWCN